MQLLRCVPQQVLQVAHKAINVALPRGLVDDVLVVIVTQTTAQLLIVHLGLVFPLAPPPGHLGEGWGESEGIDIMGMREEVFLA